MDSSSASNVSSAKKEWSEDLTTHLREGMQQILNRIKEQTVLLEKYDESVLVHSLMATWRVFSLFLSWALAFTGGKKAIKEVAREQNAQATLDSFNQALSAYCKHYDLPEIVGLNIDLWVESWWMQETKDMNPQVYYVSLICFLYLGTQHLSQLNERLREAAFDCKKGQLENLKSEEIYYTYGSVLHSLLKIGGLPDEFCSDASVDAVNQRIKKYEGMLRAIAPTILELLPIELHNMRETELLSPATFNGQTPKNWGPQGEVYMDYDFDRARIAQSASLNNQVILLKNWRVFFNNETVEPFLLKKILEDAEIWFACALHTFWDNYCDDEIEKEFQKLYQTAIEDIKNLKNERLFSSPMGVSAYDELLSSFEEFPMGDEAMQLTTLSFSRS